MAEIKKAGFINVERKSEWRVKVRDFIAQKLAKYCAYHRIGDGTIIQVAVLENSRNRGAEYDVKKFVRGVVVKNCGESEKIFCCEVEATEQVAEKWWKKATKLVFSQTILVMKPKDGDYSFIKLLDNDEWLDANLVDTAMSVVASYLGYGRGGRIFCCNVQDALLPEEGVAAFCRDFDDGGLTMVCDFNSGRILVFEQSGLKFGALNDMETVTGFGKSMATTLC